jgi:hypothetical protein
MASIIAADFVFVFAFKKISLGTSLKQEIALLNLVPRTLTGRFF